MTVRYTLLVTDIVDSTAVTEALGILPATRLWTEHDRLARDLLARHNGREIDKSDGLLLLFAETADAARFAVAYHRALCTLEPPLRARAGFHVGDIILRRNSDSDVARGAKPVEVEGVAKATAARLAALANPGQTLLSAVAMHEVGATELVFRSHGHWRLKGLAEPFEVIEAHEAGMSTDAPVDQGKAYRVVRGSHVWLPLRAVRHSLPAERDVFVGRRDALDEIAHMLEAGARLISLTGMGGTGKTRVATRFGWQSLGEYAGGVWLCDLSQARNLDGIAYAVGQALDVALDKGDPVLQLGHAIAGRGSCLIVLDNFEQISHLAEACLGRWLERAPEARFIVTTRAVLGIAGEAVLPLAPLPDADAVILFTRRAEAARRDFLPGPEEHRAIELLVRLLDCLPLAIELAAARVRVMPPSALLARMSDRFRLLSTGSGRPSRQATLRATFDWSWDLLSAAERAGLAQLSVFEGGFTLEAAEAVLDLSVADDPPWPPDVVQALLDQSFIRQSTEDRFELLASVQDYAAEHLRTPERYPGSGPAAARAAEASHFAYFADLDERQATAQRCIELDNLVHACRRAAAAGDASSATRTLELAWRALQLFGPFTAGVELAARVREVAALPDVLLARVDHVAGSAMHAVGQIVGARAHFEAALVRAKAAGEAGREARLHVDLGNLDANAARMHDARLHFDAALSIARVEADRSLECEALSGLGSLNAELGRIDDARVEYEAALAIARQIGDRRWEGGLLGNLGHLHASQGRKVQARAHFEASLIAARALGNRKWEGNTLCNLGLLHQEAREWTDARENLEGALQVARAMGHARLEAVVLCNLGLLHEAMGDCANARSHYEHAVVVARQLEDRRSEGQFLGYLGLLHAREQRFDPARRDLDRGESLLRQADDAFSLGVLLCARVEMEHLVAAPGAQAQAILAEAEAVARDVNAGLGSELADALERVRRLLVPGSGEEPSPLAAISDRP